MARKLNLLVLNWVIYLLYVSWVKWWISSDKLIKQCSQAVIIDSIAVSRSKLKNSLLCKHLRCHILWTPTVSMRHLVLSYSHLTQPKISYFQVAIHIDHNIFRFDVAINDILWMQILNPKENLDKTVSSIVFIHFAHLPQIKKELSSRAI